MFCIACILAGKKIKLMNILKINILSVYLWFSRPFYCCHMSGSQQTETHLFFFTRHSSLNAKNNHLFALNIVF